MDRSTIMYVEDEEDYQKLVSTILGEAGLPVRMAGTGEEGLRMLEREKPRLLLLDVNLPDANGYTLCQSLRKEKKWAKLPILMVTVRRRHEEWLNGFSSGANDYVSKPINPPEFLERVQACLRGQAARPVIGFEEAEYQLIQAVRAGNSGAFDVLLRKYKAQLLRSLSPQVRNAAEAEDIVSCTFMHALERLDQFHGGSSFYTWLYGIALHDLYNRSRRASHVSLDEFTGEGDEGWLPPDFVEPESKPDSWQPGVEIEKVQDLVSSVPRFHRKLLRLHLVKGMPYEEIARRLGMPIGTVASRVARAKRLLRRAWWRSHIKDYLRS